MPKRLKKVPQFKTESEEQAFWESPENDSSDYVDWNQAKVVRFPNLQPSTKTISLRLPENLLASIRVQARKLDVPYQSLMKVWLAEKAKEQTFTRSAK
ncbi:MAG TPA: BrnA antitoxin family protein [Acidobacteriaceae bacterium]